jgi:hypothetical protein
MFTINVPVDNRDREETDATDLWNSVQFGHKHLDLSCLSLKLFAGFPFCFFLGCFLI